MSFWINAPTTTSLASWLTVFGGNGLEINYDTKQELACTLANAQPPASGPGHKNWIYASTPFGSYHHIVWVVNGTSAQIYIDGVAGQSSWYNWSDKGTPLWLGTSVSMKFNPNSAAMSGIKVKNCYWFNSQLAASDVTTLFAVGA